MKHEEKMKVLRKNHPEDTTFMIGDCEVGKEVLIIAGPCAVESYEQMLASARLAKEQGAHAIRGNPFKPRTSPYDFQGLEGEGLAILARVKDEVGLPLVIEVTEEKQVALMEEVGVDVYQIGSRNCQNYQLLKHVARLGKPVLLKRGFATHLNEFLGAAEYLLDNGTDKVMLCERGIRTFNTEYRNTLDVNAIVWLRAQTHLQIIGDPSHGTGLKEMVLPASRAIIAAGGQGLIIELHCDPENALCDGHQSVTDISDIVRQCNAIYRIT